MVGAPDKSNSIAGRHSFLWVFLGVLLFFVVLEGDLFSGDRVLLTTDAAIREANKSFGVAWGNLYANWSDGVLLGIHRGAGIRLATLLKGAMNGVVWNNLVFGLACLGGSFLFLFLFRKLRNPWALLCGVLTAFWMGNNFTLIYSGHTLKPYVVLFFVCSLLPVSAATGGSIVALLIWGCCVGLMFAQQPDVAMFFALFAGAYMLFRLWRAQGFKPLKWLKVLVPAAMVAFLFAAGPLLSGYRYHVKGAAQMQTDNKQEKQAKWDYVTQWSLPPEETIDFVAPGYTGWRSGEADGPYWGRMGRSPGWEQTGQGFQNFKLDNIYLGFIPVTLAFFALFSCRRSKHRSEILFWGSAALVALLLSFGKFFPLYSLFYKLPVVNNVRAPVKFVQVFQVCLAILTAYGFDVLWRSRDQRIEDKGQKPDVKNKKSDSPTSDLCLPSSVLRTFFWILVGVLGILGFWALSLMMNSGDDVSGFVQQGWPQGAAKTIVQNKIASLWHASFMAAAITGVFAVFSFPAFRNLLRFKNWIAAGLVLIMAADAVKLSKHYVKEMPRSYIEANALTDFLKKDLGHQRVALLSQQGIYGIWTTYLLPYNRIPTFNFSDMPRMANDYKAFLEAGQRNPLNMWRFSAVKYLLGPAAVESQLAGQAQKVFSYDLAAGAKPGEFTVVPSPTGKQVVFELLNTSPRYAVIASAESLPDEQALASVNRLPRPPAGSVEVLAYRPGKVKLRVQADNPAMLRVAEKWDADWKAEMDGNAVDVQRIDYICQGVLVPAGTHEVVLRYAPSKLFFYMQCGGHLILFTCFGWIWFRRKSFSVLPAEEDCL